MQNSIYKEKTFSLKSTVMVCKVVMDRELEVMIDSGSEISLLKRNVFEELEIDTKTLKDSDLIVTQDNGQKVELSGMVRLPIEVGGIKTYSKLYIVPNLDPTMILGEDWLNRVQINFNPNQLKLKRAKIPLGIDTSREFDIYIRQYYITPPPRITICQVSLHKTTEWNLIPSNFNR